jgi:drug/metabolite transporter (DMT)-like permease
LVAKETLSKSTLTATIALIGVTAVWGSTFVVMKAAIARQPESDFLATRFTIATLCMILVRPKVLARFNKKLLSHGTLLGLALGLGYISQTYGLRITSAAVSGFITGMFVVFTPIIGAVILRRRVDNWTWLAVALATIGLALLSLHGFALGRGEMLTVLCAFSFALHIVGLGEWSSLHDSYAIAIIQLAVVSVLCWIVALKHGYKAPPDYGVWGAVVLTAIFATAIAFFIQTWAQSFMLPTRAAVIMTMEPVFAGFFAVLLGGERLTLKIILGGALVIAAMYLVELGPKSTLPSMPHLES